MRVYACVLCVGGGGGKGGKFVTVAVWASDGVEVI